jgi:hypothetical protein
MPIRFHPKNPYDFFMWKVRAYREGRTNQVRMELARIRMKHNGRLFLVGFSDNYASRAYQHINDRAY